MRIAIKITMPPEAMDDEKARHQVLVRDDRLIKALRRTLDDFRHWRSHVDIIVDCDGERRD